MTINEYLTEYLTGRGLWPAEAEAVISQWLETPGGEPLQGRVNDDTAGYPRELMVIAQLGITFEAVCWIDANKPKHFARAMFA